MSNPPSRKTGTMEQPSRAGCLVLAAKIFMRYPEAKNKKIPLADWLKYMGKTKHLLKEENKDMLVEFEQEVEKGWQRLNAKHENEYP